MNAISNKRMPVEPFTSAAPSIDHALRQADRFSLRNYYEKWAGHYDADVAAQDYCGPETMVNFLNRLPEPTVTRQRRQVMDACCGTGRVGQVLQAHGYIEISGCDLSQSMIEQAAKLGVYTNLYGDMDLTRPITPCLQRSFDLVLCCGAFIPGHLPASALRGLIAMSKRGAVIVISVREQYYQEQKFEQAYLALGRSHGLTLLARDMARPYLNDVNAHYLAFTVD